MSFSTAPIKAVADLNPETLGEDTPADAEYSYAEISDVAYGLPIQWQEPRPFEQLPSRARRLARDGDIVVSTVRTYLRAVARVEDSPDNAVASTGFAVLRPKAVESRYLGYALLSAHFVEAVVAQSVGVSYPAINASDVARIHLPLPTPTEQRQIADYLDHETAEIDAFIADLEAMRMQLEERWGSALVEIVQGRDHDDVIHTGIDVWPLAPTSWLRTRLKSTVAASTNGVWGEEPASSSGTRCIRVADFDKLRGRVHDLNPTSRQYDASVVSRMGLRDGDLILEKSGGGPTNPVGNVVRYDGGGGDMYSNFVARIRVSGAVDSAYALRLHQSLYASGVTARSVKQTTGIQNLDESAYFDEPVFLPGHDEQKVIARALTAERESTDDTVADIDAAIALAKERRAALITAAVTGQIDVTMKHRPVVDSIQTAIDGSR